MKHLLLIATGGTIASKSSGDGLTPGITSEELLACVPEAAEICRITAHQIFNLDSTNLQPKHWLEIAGFINTTALSSPMAQTPWHTPPRRFPI